MKFNVLKQCEPIPTGERMPLPSNQWWHRANLVKVGEANSMEEAKQFCKAPVLELRR